MFSSLPIAGRRSNSYSRSTCRALENLFWRDLNNIKGALAKLRGNELQNVIVSALIVAVGEERSGGRWRRNI